MLCSMVRIFAGASIPEDSIFVLSNLALA